MKKFEFFLGIDISKNTLDYCLLDDQCKVLEKGKVNNEPVSLSKFFLKFENEYCCKTTLLIVFENTGIYSKPVARFLNENKWCYSEVSALEIKRSKGVSRGKSDRVDAHQIAQYGFRNLDKIMLCTEPELIHQQLKILNTEREKMLSAIGSFSRTSEAEEFLGKEVFKVVKTHNRQTLSALRKQLKQLEDKISELLRSNEDLKKKQELLKTIPGIAEVGSLYLLLATKGFTRFKNWRKFACYCGIAPFEYSSGSSIRGRNRVNPLADKKMKSLLHLLALTSIRHDPELKLYYERKKEEGKHSLLALNNVKCKLVSRIFAVIKRETPYVKTHQYAN